MSALAPTAPAQVSPHAIPGGARRRGAAARTMPVYGLCVHTTGSGPAKKARKGRRTALQIALNYYVNGREGFPHYLIDYDGSIHTVCDEGHVAWHAGWYSRGGKRRWSSWTAPAWWSSVWRRWNVATPAALLPAQAGDPNSVYIGVELLADTSGWGFTSRQYEALARLIVDVFRRHGVQLAEPPNPRLLGHEDLEPVERSNAQGGWDPGAHRRVPKFSWSALWSRIQAAGAGGTGVSPPVQAPPAPAPSLPTEATAAVARGERDPSRLTNIVFFARHPERGGRAIARGEAQAAQEWLRIRDEIVRPLLANVSAEKHETAAPDVVRYETPSVVTTIQDALRRGLWSVAAGLSILGGNRDENALANMIFFARHPELGGRRIRSDERTLVQEWLDIRDGIVKRALEAVQTRPAATPPAPTPGFAPTTGFGVLTAQLPGASPFSYRFTADDALWLARFIRGEAGGRNTPENHAVIWSMFNRYALFTHPQSYYGRKAGVDEYPTFASFIRRYSTTLQPYLKSCGAVERAKRYDRQGSQKWVPLGGTITDAKTHRVCEKGQLQKHLDLQQQPWDHPNLASSRELARAALTGRVSNPIGLATNFGDTAAYYVDAHPRPRSWPKGEPYPSLEQWRLFTAARGARHEPPWTWIGEQPNLEQYKKNSFFVDNRLADLHARGVEVVQIRAV